ncbi:MAG: uracil-DNA glycosylase [Chromatiales bacterium 21-64-14]|nr:MAG: uracil-DNA glycosylase [Chromatiales bacterium 21-64-14]HQU14784.1 uracil-DNA glycosylase [Gammaproteobacteria bacterium]
MTPERRARYLDALGIPCWVPRQGNAGETGSGVAPPSPSEGPASRQGTFPAGIETGPGGLGWDALEARVAACTLCGLHQTRSRTVFGVGDREATWMVVGEAPGAEEDRQGEPFVGRAGKLLNAMLAAIGLERRQVYIANILKCRPPENRDPRPEEAACCEPYLRRQVELVRPRVILALGRIAAHHLLGTTTSLARLRGQTHRYGVTDIPVVVTYHPAYLLRSPGEKRKAWVDLLYARNVCARGDPVRV